MLYAYYEEGAVQYVDDEQLPFLYATKVDSNQKLQGTDFASWKSEMIKMQILNPVK